ncbi:hypothetical protein IRJ41_013290 [Triplophysa rosa]|uniref:Uncharacterized protein n=1 Tax=Triplophysa rosa TaxID=992332 RepID=A0A9W7X2U6_TRIRA|nr:hypothetical protein IRJ41_013290 [Triplophysa rosa]
MEELDEISPKPQITERERHLLEDRRERSTPPPTDPRMIQTTEYKKSKNLPRFMKTTSETN